MTTRWKVFDANQTARYEELPLTNVSLFREEEFSACLLGFLPGQVLPRHSHQHEHEVFDVLAGSGTIWLDGESIEAGPGAIVFVPAGVEHGFENSGSERWLIRATIHERTYGRLSSGPHLSGWAGCGGNRNPCRRKMCGARHRFYADA